MIRTLGKLIESLRENPIAFALIVLNVIWIAAGLWVYQDQMKRYANVIRFVAEHCDGK